MTSRPGAMITMPDLNESWFNADAKGAGSSSTLMLSWAAAIAAVFSDKAVQMEKANKCFFTQRDDVILHSPVRSVVYCRLSSN